MFPNVTRGKNFASEHFRVVVKSDTELKNPKCAVVVSNKIAKTAVARNRIRRQVYGVLGEMTDKLPTGFISVFPKVAEIESSEIKKELSGIFK